MPTDTFAAAHRDDRTKLAVAGGPDTVPSRFAAVLRSVRGVPTRRDVLHGLAATGLGLSLAALPARTEAKPKRRKKRKRPQPAKPNQYGCLEVNDPCRRHLQCCSGRCTGQPGKKRCRAHGTGTCNQVAPAYCETALPPLTYCDNSQHCICMRTTAGTSYCGSAVTSDCAACKRDTDCVALGFPPGSACAPFATGICAGYCASGTMCMAPCEGFQPPPSPPA